LFVKKELTVVVSVFRVPVVEVISVVDDPVYI
jgi:hypothetical protein